MGDQKSYEDHLTNDIGMAMYYYTIIIRLPSSDSPIRHVLGDIFDMLRPYCPIRMLPFSFFDGILHHICLCTERVESAHLNIDNIIITYTIWQSCILGQLHRFSRDLFLFLRTEIVPM